MKTDLHQQSAPTTHSVDNTTGVDDITEDDSGDEVEFWDHSESHEYLLGSHGTFFKLATEMFKILSEVSKKPTMFWKK